MKRIGVLLLIFSFQGSLLFSQDQQDTIRQKKSTSFAEGKATQLLMSKITKTVEGIDNCRAGSG